MSQGTSGTEQEIVNENQARAIVYNFISSFFAKEVNESSVAQLTSEQGQSFLNSLAFEPTLAPAINEINKKVSKLNSEESLLELAADFCGLFLVDGKTSVSPYAGQYLSNKPTNSLKDDASANKKIEKIQLFGELHQKVTEFLTDSELQIHSNFPEPGDHIAVILAYTAHLCVSVAPKEQLEFINHYLVTWINDFIQQVHKHDQGLFYRSLADLMLEWIKIDTSSLQSSE